MAQKFTFWDSKDITSGREFDFLWEVIEKIEFGLMASESHGTIAMDGIDILSYSTNSDGQLTWSKL